MSNQQLPVNTFMTQATNKQLQKKTGGIPTVWTETEMEDLRVIAEGVAIGNYSQSQAVASYREARKTGKVLGNIRPNKSPTAFKQKLSELLRKLPKHDDQETASIDQS